jgi:hypothetical protein
MSSFDLIGVGSPIMDLLAQVPEDFLARHVAGDKGGMVLVDDQEMARIVGLLGHPPARTTGGSAANAQHLAAELLGRLRPHVNRPPIPAIALAMDSSSMTACGNDYSYEEFYARMVEGLGDPGDVLVGITISGKSPNVCKAFEKARSLDIRTVGFLGCGGGPALPLCDEAKVAP